MQVLFGTLGLLQSTLLPGLLLIRLCRLRGGIFEQLLRLLPMSLMTNYLLIFLLAKLHLYKKPVMLVLSAAEFVGILVLYRDVIRRPAGEIFSRISEAFRRELRPLGDFLTERHADRKTALKAWIWALSGCFALSGVLWGLHLCRLNFGTVFSGWDTLFSWNNYAVMWAGGSVPKIGGMYPQLVPANWSLSYVLQGKDAVQFFNTLLPPLFFLMIEGMLFDLGFQRRESAFFFAAVIARFMMKKLMGDQLFDGYMDVPAAAMCLLSVYTFLKGENRPLAEQRQAVVLGVLFAGGAAITKQSGFAALLLALPAAALIIPDGLNTMSRKQKALLCAAVLVTVLPWYLHCFLFNTRGAERELIAEGIVSYNTQYDIHHRLRLASETLGKYGLCFLLSLIGLPFVPKRYRLLFSLYIWPMTAIWAISYSYDARNLGPVLPFVSMLDGLALAGIGSFAGRISERIRIGKIPAGVFVLLAAAAAAGLLIRLYPDPKLREDQRIRQKALFGEQLNNDLLYGIFGESHDGNDIYTDYPAWFLSGYSECCSAAELTDDFQVRSVLEGDKINWMMLPVVMPNHTDPSKALIEQCIADGKCEKIRCSDGYYKSYCLYKINR